MANEKALKQVEHELDCLAKAQKEMISRMHYSTISDLLMKSGLPYTLEQSWKNDIGEYSRNYLYRFTSKWDSEASLYVQETSAGRLHKSMWDAMDDLKMELNRLHYSLVAND